MYYLQSRYYDPTTGRFLNADVYVSTGQGILGCNMFAYCNNNPVLYLDSTGSRLEIWDTLFGAHDPGFIHRAVQDHIVWNGLLFRQELYLKGVGRADIYNPATGEIWEIKHGGGTLERQHERIQDAFSQVNKYVSKYTDIALCAGDAGTFTGAFVINHGKTSYCVSYYTPSPGVILYYVVQLKRFEPAASYVCEYELSYTTANAIGAAALGIAALTFLHGLISGARGQTQTA